MKPSPEQELQKLSAELTRSFNRWDYIYEHGSTSPFYADGADINLVRNHIIYFKNSIELLIRESESQPTLFPLTYPEIYHRQTPEELPYDFMANPEAIRTRALEQITLYEQDPNFCYIRDHFKDVFPKGQTKGTKSAGLNYYATAGYEWYRKYIERDDLVNMRMRFREPYEEKAPRWAQYAAELKDYLSKEHDMNDSTPAPDHYEEEDDYCSDPIPNHRREDDSTVKHPPLQKLIANASDRTSEKDPHEKKPHQLSLF